MNKVEKIKSEIERLKKSLPWGNCASQLSMECNCKNEAYNEVLSYINSLEEEPISNDLKEAAHSYVDTTIECFDSESNPCCYPAFIAGAEWQKEKMMENAVDGEIYFSMDYLQYRINTEPLAHFHHGDKVKLIIIK